MKTLFIKLFLLGVVNLLLFGACDKKELEDYSGPNSIYFDFQWNNKSVSFLTRPGGNIDTSFTVFALGEVAAYDRKFELTVDDSSTLERGVHFDVDLVHTMPAGRVSVEVPVVLHRHPDLQEEGKKFIIVLRLLETPDFNLDLKDVSGIDVRKCYLTVTDGVKRPAGWADSGTGNYYKYFGKYSLKKLLLLIEVSEKPASFFYEYMTPATYQAISRAGRLYLEKQEPKIMDEDNTPMVMGEFAL